MELTQHFGTQIVFYFGENKFKFLLKTLLSCKDKFMVRIFLLTKEETVLSGDCGSLKIPSQVVICSHEGSHCTQELICTEEDTFNFQALERTQHS